LLGEKVRSSNSTLLLHGVLELLKEYAVSPMDDDVVYVGSACRLDFDRGNTFRRFRPAT